MKVYVLIKHLLKLNNDEQYYSDKEEIYTITDSYKKAKEIKEDYNKNPDNSHIEGINRIIEIEEYTVNSTEGHNTIHPYITEHINNLQDYFLLQRQLIDTTNIQPINNHEENNKKVRLIELNNEMNKITRRLQESITNLGTIKDRE